MTSHADGRKFVEGVRWESFKQFAFAWLVRIYPLQAFVLLGFLLLELFRVPLYDAGYLHTEPFTKDMSPYLLGLNLVMRQTIVGNAAPLGAVLVPPEDR
ncbi:hypothetical protein [Teichococcus aestuarii]|uniref:hypothetical protein n=1 Tax=Teichococcus aestuarii TaxID=568898 RepID=UPI001FE27CAE|nr:hypothetical protein [Pseudoroseomonas aestuarii]